MFVEARFVQKSLYIVSDEGVFRTDCSSSVTRLIVERQTANLSRINGNSDQNTEQRN